MQYGSAPYADLPFADFPGPGNSIEDALERLSDEPWLKRSWLVRALPRDPTTSTIPITTIPVDLSTDGHRSFPTDAEEVQFDARVINPYTLSYRMKTLWGLVRSGEGKITFSNASGDLTVFGSYDWFGREIKVFLGPKDGILIQFAQVANLLTVAFSRNKKVVTLSVDDYARIFDDEIQRNTYDGTGGLEGGAELKGKIKPLALGFVEQIQPPVVDATNRIYQIHDGSFKSVSTVDDQGVPLVFDADVADITTATPSAGEYSTSLATGYFKLGSDPVGTVTCSSVEGHNSSSFGYVEDIAGLTKLLAVTFAGLDEISELDGVDFADLSSRMARMGEYVIEKRTTIANVLSVFNRSAASWAWLTPNKLLKVGRIEDPDTATVDFTLDGRSAANGGRDELRFSPWKEDPWEMPVHRVFVGYKRYYRTLSESELDVASIPDLDERLDLGEEYRFVETPQGDSDTILGQTPRAKQLTILTNLADESDAQSLADEQLALRRVQRRKSVFSPRVGLIIRGIGDVFALTDDRLHDSPKNFVIIGVKNSASGAGSSDKIQFECYG